MLHFDQICFTRISGTGSGDGWQSVNESPTIKGSAISAFTGMQNSNTVAPQFDTVDQQEQIVTELCPDDESVFYTRIKYNVGVDDKGRAIIFAHSFAFRLDEFVRNFHDVLRLSNENFHYSVEQTAAIPNDLVLMEKVELKQCVSLLDLKPSIYTSLMRCIYYVLSGKVKTTLHIICDCKPETIYQYLVCIYSALPVSFRKKVSFSNYTPSSSAVRTIVFDRQIKNRADFYFDPKTGNNNVLNELLNKKMNQYAFIDTVPQKVMDPAFSPESFFAELDDELNKFANGQNITLDLYNVAYGLLKIEREGASKDENPQALLKRMYDLLCVPILHPYIDQQIQYVYADIVERKVKMPPAMVERVGKRVESTSISDLVLCHQQYLVNNLFDMDDMSAAKYLYDTYANRNDNSEGYVRIKQLLQREPRGEKILEEVAVMLAKRMQVDERHILEFYNNTRDIKNRSRIDGLLFELLERHIPNLAKLIPNDDSLFDRVAVLASDIQIHESLASDLMTLCKKAYWDCYKIENMEITEQFLESLESPKFKMEKHPKWILAFEISEIALLIATGDSYALSEAERRLAKYYLNSNSVLSTEQKQKTRLRLFQAITVFESRCIEERKPICLDAWLVFLYGLRGGDIKPIDFLVSNNIYAMCRAFETEYSESWYLKHKKEYETWFLNSLKECESVHKKDERFSCVSEALQYVQKFEKGKKVEESHIIGTPYPRPSYPLAPSFDSEPVPMDQVFVKRVDEKGNFTDNKN